MLENRLIHFTIAFLAFIFAASFLIVSTLNEIETKFVKYKTVAINGKITSLEISKDINYISRCSRDIMLGNLYNANLAKIKRRIKKIEENFLVLEKSIDYMQDIEENTEIFLNARKSTYSFIYDVLDKMEDASKYKDLTRVYALYKKESTPLAVKSRDYFEELEKKQDESFQVISRQFERDMKRQKDIVFSSALLFAFLIIVFVLAISKKIIAHLKTEEELSNTKKLLVQYKDAIDKTNIVSKTDAYGRITYVNDTFCKVSQYSEDELIGCQHSIIRHPNMPKETFSELWKCIKDKKPWQGVVENRKKDGSSYFVDTSIFPILNKEGNVEEFIAIRKDITEFIELNKELKDSREEILTRIGMIAETRSKETSNHVRRVAEYSKILAESYGLDEKEIDVLYNATALHDIGKVVTPDHILNKPGKLTLEEYAVMKKHATDGYNMLKDTNNKIIKAGSVIAHEHHEKWDGSGYPRGIAGKDIHIYARITAIADVFDALGSSRSYKSPWDLNTIIEFINEQSGKHFDPRLVEIFNERFDDFMFVRKKFKSEY